MLVLGRRRGESIDIFTSDGVVNVKVLDKSTNKMIELGVSAPSTVKVLRKELTSNDNCFTKKGKQDD